MADKSTKNDSLDIEFPPDLDDDLGEDWASAFEAEDFAFSPEDEDSEFFLQEDNASGESYDLAAMMSESDTEGKTDLSKEKATEEGEIPGDDKSPKGGIIEALLARLPFLEKLTPFYTRITPLIDRFKQLPKKIKIIASAFPAILSILFLAFVFLGSEQSEEVAGTQISPQPEKNVLSEQKETSATPPTVQKDEPPETKSTDSTPKWLTEPTEKIRKKWPQGSFFIATQKENSEIFVGIDMTLVLRLMPGEQLPEKNKVIVRDAIYQFYKDKSAHDLERYSLARGEMIRNLSRWLKKQWPEGHIESIVFNRYQVYR